MTIFCVTKKNIPKSIHMLQSLDDIFLKRVKISSPVSNESHYINGVFHLRDISNGDTYAISYDELPLNYDQDEQLFLLCEILDEVSYKAGDFLYIEDINYRITKVDTSDVAIGPIKFWELHLQT